MRNSLMVVLVALVCLVSSEVFAGGWGCGGGSYYSGGYYSSGYSGYSGCGSYYSGPVYRGRVYYGPVYGSSCGTVVYDRCATTYSSNTCGCCGAVMTTNSAVQKTTEKPTQAPQNSSPLPATPPNSSPLPPDPKPAVETDQEEAKPLPPKEEFDTTFNIRIRQPNGEMLTAKVKHGFMPQIKTIDGQRWAVYDGRIPFAKYKKMYERQGYVTYVHRQPQQSVLVAAR